MMIPDPCAVVIDVVRTTTDRGATESDVIRWVGVTVGVAGVVLATPDGIASAWLSAKNWLRRAWAFVRRLLHLPGRAVNVTGMTATANITAGGKAYADRWQPWREDAEDGEKIDILHQQTDILSQRITELRTQTDRTSDELQREIGEAEARVTGQHQQLASQLWGERREASRVNARGFGPIALGIILTGLPDELASVAAVGWLAIAVAVIWVGRHHLAGSETTSGRCKLARRDEGTTRAQRLLARMSHGLAAQPGLLRDL